MTDNTSGVGVDVQVDILVTRLGAGLVDDAVVSLKLMVDARGAYLDREQRKPLGSDARRWGPKQLLDACGGRTLRETSVRMRER